MLTFLKIFAVFVLVFVNGFFVAAEFAFVGVRRSRIEALAAGGDRRAKRLLNLLDDLNAYLSASQLGITLASLALGWIGEPVVAHLLEAPLAGRVSEAVMETISFAIAFTIITALHIVLGEQAPKILGLERAQNIALVVAWPMQVFYKLFQWPIRALNWASAQTVRLVGLHATDAHASIYTAEEIRQLVDQAHEGGHLKAEEKSLINRIFDFFDTEVQEAMVPRPNVVALRATATLDEAEEAFRQSGYSRLPVYRERFDEILGTLFLRDIIPFLKTEPEEFRLEEMLHPPIFVPATARLGDVLTQMQSEQKHIAFVVDEHGGVEGIVTLEDLLEEIVGEINDEFDEKSRAQIIEDGGTYILDGMLNVRDVNRRFNLHLPEEGGYTRLAGFLVAKAGRLLLPGESIEHEGARFTVERVDRRRIRRIRLTPAIRSQEVS
ncbi:MAG: hemolysin family protein [Pyrinomonadaceae bacterium]